jgi:periplasmic divalent cation tolerance protein
VTERLLVLSTVGSAEDAERLARGLLERRLAACVNVVPGVVSFYRWKDAVQKDEERLLVMKTRADRFPALQAALREMHPYEVPEVVAFRISDGAPSYLRWLDESVGDDEGPA